MSFTDQLNKFMPILAQDMLGWREFKFWPFDTQINDDVLYFSKPRCRYSNIWWSFFFWLELFLRWAIWPILLYIYYINYYILKFIRTTYICFYQCFSIPFFKSCILCITPTVWKRYWLQRFKNYYWLIFYAVSAIFQSCNGGQKLW